MSLNERYNTLSAEMIKGMGDEEDKKRKIYEKLWKENVFWSDFGKKDDNSKNNNNVNIKKTIHRGKPSNNSFSFCSEYKYNGKDEDEDILLGQLSSKLKEKKLTENERAAIKEELRIIHNLKCQTLIDAFHIKEENQGFFKIKFKQAVSGSGQELNKINRLHSSSLCCLLFFYNVTEDNSLTLTLTTKSREGERTRTVGFTKSIFEFKNKVVNGRGASNIDVLLIGKDQKDGKEIKLFLESKFAEYYLYSGRTCEIGEGYFNTGWSDYDIYQNILNQLEAKKVLKLIEDNKNGKIVHKLKAEESFYIKGLLQMASHYIGIRNYIKENCDTLNNNNIVILGEMVFDFSEEKIVKALTAYQTGYRILADIISKEDNNSNFEILNEPRLYSEFRDNKFKVDEKVKAFYGMN